MDDGTGDALEAIAKEPDELDGHTIEELADYLDAGRQPPDPSIDGSAACRHALAALERLRVLAPDLLTDDAAPQTEDDWVGRVMSGIALDAHAGKDFRLADAGPRVEAVMTEGALRALVRRAGDDEPGFLVGRVRFPNGLDDPAAPLEVRIGVVIAHGIAIPAAADRLRSGVAAAVRRHTPFERVRIDVDVDDLLHRSGDAA